MSPTIRRPLLGLGLLALMLAVACGGGGDDAPEATPTTAPATGDQQVTSGNPCGTTMVVTPLDAEVDLDARIDGVGSAGAIDGSRRALEGERFIRIAMRATGDSGQCGGANVMDDLFRLRIDGVPRGPVNNVNDIVRPGEAVDFEVLYRAPADATELVLLAGAPAGTVAEYPLTFESLSP